MDANLARLDERLKALEREIRIAVKNLTRAARTAEIRNQRALSLAARELSRRLHELNGETGRMKELHAAMVTSEKFDAKIGDVLRRLELLEGSSREWAGRTVGEDRTRSGFHASWLIVSGAIGLLLGVIGTAVGVISALRHP
jgi:hypothetical protein